MGSVLSASPAARGTRDRMKYLLILLTVIVLAALAGLLVLGRMSRSGHSPGLLDGTLQKCPASPNCVCSESDEHSGHFIEPLATAHLKEDNALGRLKPIIVELGGRIEAETDSYLAATFASSVFGFVDDLEARVDAQEGVIHIRSASRVGYSDLGVNRTRVEKIRRRFQRGR